MFNFRKNKTAADLGHNIAKLCLRLSNFQEQETVPTEQILALIDRLPAHHLQKLDEIVYDPLREVPELLENPTEPLHVNSLGAYIQTMKTILIFDFHNRTQLFHVLLHEIAHHVYYSIIDSRIKKQWVTEICRNAPFISLYASTNASEDFAESYTSFILTPEKLRQIPLKYQFMLNHVFHGRVKNQTRIDIRL